MHSLNQAPKPDFKKIWWLVGALVFVVALVVVWCLWPKHPDADRQEVKQLLKDNAPAISSASFKNELQPPAISVADHLWGDSQAKLGLIVYEDLSQSFAANLDQNLEQLKKDHSADLKIAYRPFFANGSEGLETAQAVDCAFAQGKGWEYRQEILAIVKSRSLSTDDFPVIAKKVGLDQKKFQACSADEKKAADLTAQTKEAAKYGIIGSPTLFVGDEMIIGARPLTDFVDSGGDHIEGLNTVVLRKLK